MAWVLWVEQVGGFITLSGLVDKLGWQEERAQHALVSDRGTYQHELASGSNFTIYQFLFFILLLLYNIIPIFPVEKW